VYLVILATFQPRPAHMAIVLLELVVEWQLLVEPDVLQPEAIVEEEVVEV
jgi:hypothetical protein